MVVYDRVLPVHDWSVACHPTLSVCSLLLCRPLWLLNAWIRLWALNASSWAGEISWLARSPTVCRPTFAQIKSLNRDSGLTGTVGVVLFALYFDASVIWILLQLHSIASSTSGFGLVHCNIAVCDMPIYLVSQAFLPWHQCVSFWWQSRIGRQEETTIVASFMLPLPYWAVQWALDASQKRPWYESELSRLKPISVGWWKLL